MWQCMFTFLGRLLDVYYANRVDLLVVSSGLRCVTSVRAKVAAVDLRVVLLGFRYSRATSYEISEIDTVLCLWHVAAISCMHFVVPV